MHFARSWALSVCMKDLGISGRSVCREARAAQQDKSVLLCFVVVAILLVATDLVCLHDVSLMYTCVKLPMEWREER
jgi:hypothetical protein